MSTIGQIEKRAWPVVALFRDRLALTIERGHNERFMELVDRAMPNWRNYCEQLNPAPSVPLRPED